MDTDISMSIRYNTRGRTKTVWVNGEHFLSARAEPLSDENWAALEQAEKPLYQGEHSANAWTDVCPNEGNPLLNELWEQATYGVESDNTDADRREIARRVAAALAVLSFGKDFLLK